MNSPSRPEPIRFTRGRRMYQIAANHADREGYVGLCDGRVVTRGVDRAEVARILIRTEVSSA